MRTGPSELILYFRAKSEANGVGAHIAPVNGSVLGQWRGSR